MFFMRELSSLACFLALVPSTLAVFSPSSSSNVAVYWGQNSYGQGTGQYAQQRLSYYCANSEIDIIPIGFLVVIANPTLNFANAGDNCTAFPGSNLFNCPQLAADIVTCQTTYKKTILLSVGGATYSEGGFSSSSAAVSAANNIWSIFGPQQSGSSALRPFGSAVVDGFDFDFEASTQNMAPFANQLRSLMDGSTAAGGKKYYLTAAPQCPYPDVADNDMLNGSVYFDAIWIQFYNNYCGVNSFKQGQTQDPNSGFNFVTWDNWAKTVSKNKNVKVMLGVPGAPGAGGGYEPASWVANVIAYSKQYSSFGGVMIWDASQLYTNSGFLDSIKSALGSSTTPPPVTSTIVTSTTSKPVTSSKPTTMVTSTTSKPVTSSTPTTMVTSTRTTSAPATTTTAALVNQWNQCGGQGWNGGTVCVAPYVCTYQSVWYSMCE